MRRHSQPRVERTGSGHGGRPSGLPQPMNRFRRNVAAGWGIGARTTLTKPNRNGASVGDLYFVLLRYADSCPNFVFFLTDLISIGKP